MAVIKRTTIFNKQQLRTQHLLETTFPKGLNERRDPEYKVVDRKRRGIPSLHGGKTIKKTCGIQQSVETGELFECCSTELGDDIIRENRKLLEGTEKDLLAAIKRLAIIPVAKTVRRSDVLQMRQDHDEAVRAFYARVKGKADTCAYVVKCTHSNCGQQVDYTNEVIKDMLVTGLSDAEIRRDVLGWPDLDAKTAVETVTFIESKEMARNALLHSNSGSMNALSNYRKHKKIVDKDDGIDKKTATGKCPSCGKDYRLFIFFKKSKKFNEKPFPTCFDCSKRSKNLKTDGEVPGGGEASALFSSIGAISEELPDDSHSEEATTQQSDVVVISTNTTHGKVIAGLQNMTFDRILGWKRAQKLSHPRLRLRAIIEKTDYIDLGLNYISITPFYIDVVTDSGAQSCVWSMKGFILSGFKTSDLIPVKHSMAAANKLPIKIVGAILLRLSGKDDHGRTHECAVMVYISPDVEDFFLSEDAMKQLAIIPKDFPRIGAAKQTQTIQDVAANIANLTLEPQKDTCPAGCIKRTPTPGLPACLPFPAIPENVTKFEEYCKSTYASSVFNKCPHQPLPEMV